MRELVDAGAEAIVVSLVNATENPEHELAIQEIILDEFPPHELGAIPVLLGHQVSGRKGEYVRATSTIIDGFLHEIMFHALSQLSNNLRDFGYDQPMLVIHNSGGMAQMNSTDALQTIHSGPIAGVGAAEHLSTETGLGHVISTDMGGTSFDIGLVPEGGVKHYDFLPTIDRWLVSVPMVHLDTLGAGGGSIATYDRIHHSIKIGPESAGSNPGPACYDRGGLKPTVTDADLLLGYLDPDNYANGYITLNPKRSRFAIEETLCDELDMDVLDIARVDQGRGRRADGHRHREGAARPRLPSRGLHHARLRRQRPAARVRHRPARGHQTGSRAPLLVGLLRVRGREHEAAALPRARGARDDVQRDDPRPLRPLRRVQLGRRGARGPRPGGPGPPGLPRPRT